MKSVLHQQRKIAAVIDVRVRQHHRGNVFAGERKVPVALFGFLSAALILAAIQQIALVVDRQLMHGAGDHLGRAPKGEFHPLKNTLGTQVNPRLVTKALTDRFRMDAEEADALSVCSCAALAPSAYLAWTLRTMPHLGFYHDDSIYWVSGRSLAMGDGYRIQSLPGEPYQTKYPPLYPGAAGRHLETQSAISLESSAGHAVRLAAVAAVLWPLLWFLLRDIRIQSARAILS